MHYHVCLTPSVSAVGEEVLEDRQLTRIACSLALPLHGCVLSTQIPGRVQLHPVKMLYTLVFYLHICECVAVLDPIELSYRQL